MTLINNLNFYNNMVFTRIEKWEDVVTKYNNWDGFVKMFSGDPDSINIAEITARMRAQREYLNEHYELIREYVVCKEQYIMFYKIRPSEK